MADDMQVDKTTFFDRISSLYTLWKADKREAFFSGANALIVLTGRTEKDGLFRKHTAFQSWSLGYEFPATLIVLTLDTIYFVTSVKKAEYLKSIKGGNGSISVELLLRGKDAEENKGQFVKCVEAIKKAGKKVGVLKGITASGPFAEEWQAEFSAISKNVEEVDWSAAVSQLMAVKDERELRLLRDACRADCQLNNWFVDQMSNILDDDKQITHRDLASKVFNKIDPDKNDLKKFFGKAKLSSQFDSQQLDWAYPPTVQSGGSYDLSLKTDSDGKNLHDAVIVSALGIRHQLYASLVARTYLVDPTKQQEKNYEFLLQVHEVILKEIRDGVVANRVYQKAMDFIKSKKPELQGNFVKSVGTAVGLETRDNSLVLNAKSQRVLKDGMTFTITTGFSDLKNSEAKDKRSETYSLLIADTVRVSMNETVVFTKDAPFESSAVLFFFRDEEEKQETPKKKKDNRIGAVATTNIQKTRLRADRSTNQDAEKDAARKEHQKELHSKKQEIGLQRYGKDSGAVNGVEEKKFKRFESYKRDNQFPTRSKDLIIVVDEKAQTIVVPIMGRPVPFHIHTIKNASRTEEDGFAFLRINFLSPGQGVGRKDDQPFEDPNAHFVRSLTFRSKDKDRMEEIVNQISELKKSSVRKEQEKKELEDVVEQDKLIEIRNRRPVRMEPVFIRPGIEGKRLPGAIEIHQNGLRYLHSMGGQKVDVLFSNIKHLFFQPCDHELIVIIHVHLVNPIMIGKRKTKDVQFYREATEIAFDETGVRKRKHRYGDEEEFEAEQEERRRRAQLNKEFKAFTERIADAGRQESLGVDIPFRELGFTGVPSRSSVLVQPTTDCLIQLTEPPFLVVTLADIEVVHLERVQFGLKNFDMVLVLKDFSKPPIHVNTIPMETLDQVKDWLDSVDIPFSEGPMNLQWTQIMKHVAQDPHTFFKDGGWAFLNIDSDDEDEKEEEISEESAFEVSDSELAEMSGESSEDDSEFDEDASDDESDEDAEALSDEGEDWDEMEAKAKKSDQAGGLDDDDKKKKKRR